jgi:hypothetical protein
MPIAVSPFAAPAANPDQVRRAVAQLSSAARGRSKAVMDLAALGGERYARGLIDGQPAIILTVWERFIEMLARTSIGLGAMLGSVDVDEIDKHRRP